MKISWIRFIFTASGIYDGILGFVIFFLGYSVYDANGVMRPNHIGYIQFPALLLIIFGIMFLQVGKSPVKYRGMMWYGIGLKIAYAGLVFYYLMADGIPFMWVPFAILDTIFLILFIASWMSVRGINPELAG
jgi:hypothetical protein